MGRNGNVLAGGDGNRKNMKGHALHLDEFAHRLAETGGVVNERAVVGDERVSGEAGDALDDLAERGAEGEAFDEPNEEFATVEVLPGGGVAGASGGGAVFEEREGGMVVDFAEIEAEVEMGMDGGGVVGGAFRFAERLDEGRESARDDVQKIPSARRW